MAGTGAVKAIRQSSILSFLHVGVPRVQSRGVAALLRPGDCAPWFALGGGGRLDVPILSL